MNELNGIELQQDDSLSKGNRLTVCFGIFLIVYYAICVAATITNKTPGKTAFYVLMIYGGIRVLKGDKAWKTSVGILGALNIAECIYVFITHSGDRLINTYINAEKLLHSSSFLFGFGIFTIICSIVEIFFSFFNKDINKYCDLAFQTQLTYLSPKMFNVYYHSGQKITRVFGVICIVFSVMLLAYDRLNFLIVRYLLTLPDSMVATLMTKMMDANEYKFDFNEIMILFMAVTFFLSIMYIKRRNIFRILLGIIFGLIFVFVAEKALYYAASAWIISRLDGTDNALTLLTVVYSTFSAILGIIVYFVLFSKKTILYCTYRKPENSPQVVAQTDNQTEQLSTKSE